MLFILYGGHTGMGSKGREFFKQHGVSIVKKYHFCESAPDVTTFYEPRNFVDKLSFYENTDPMYRYTVGNIHTGFNRSEIVEAVSGDKDCLLTLSTERIEIIQDLKNTYGDAVQVIYAYTDDITLREIFNSMNILPQEIELRCSIGRTLKKCYKSNPSLFDYTIVYSGEGSLFDYENMVNQYNTFYIKVTEKRDDTPAEILRCVQEIRKTVTETSHTVSKMNETLKQLVDFFQNGLQNWLQHEKQWLSQTTRDKDDELSIAASMARSNYYINEHVSSAVCLVNQEKERLQQIFGPTWGKLLPSTKISLISSEVLWRSCQNMDDQDFDFSGICVTSTTALENELKVYFYTGFQEYLKNQYGNPAQSDSKKDAVWPKELLDEKNPSLIGNNFTLGKLPYLFCSSKNTRNRKEMNAYLKTVLKKPEKATSDWWAINKLDQMLDTWKWTRDPDSFVSRCDQIRLEYRNPAAHSGIVDRHKAEECSVKIIGKADAFIHNANIQGLIMELYSYLE